jgi:hypothetical protein
MPFEESWSVPTLEGRFPNSVMLEMDEKRFKRGIEAHAIWTDGTGEFATLAYCGGELTIKRYKPLKALCGATAKNVLLLLQVLFSIDLAACVALFKDFESGGTPRGTVRPVSDAARPQERHHSSHE